MDDSLSDIDSILDLPMDELEQLGNDAGSPENVSAGPEISSSRENKAASSKDTTASPENNSAGSDDTSTSADNGSTSPENNSAAASPNPNTTINEPPIPSPPPVMIFQTEEEGTQFIKRFGLDNGFAVVKKRSQRDRQGHIARIHFECDRGRNKATPRQLQQRQQLIEQGQIRPRMATSRRIGCPFTAVMYHNRFEGHWLLRVKHPTHNHTASVETATEHPSHRRAYLLKHLDEIKAQIEQAFSAKHIIAKLRERDPDCPLQNRDIYNLRLKMDAELAKQTPITFYPGDPKNFITTRIPT